MKSGEKFLRQFGIKIREMRVKKGISQKELAHRSGLAPELIAAVEKGQVEVSLKGILQLMEGLGYRDDESLVNQI